MMHSASKRTSNRLACLFAGLLASIASASALADSIIAAEAVRSSLQQANAPLTLRWIASPSNLKVDIYQAESPQAPLSRMRKIASAVEAGSFSTGETVGSRSYFALQPTALHGEAEAGVVRVAQRLLPLEGGRNFRDLGGYESRDGRRVKWGQVYRSGVMNRLSDEDYEFLAPLSIATVVDFRSAEERSAEPTRWRAGSVETIARDYSQLEGDESMALLFSALRSPDSSPDSVAQIMADSYLQIALDQRETYSQMFETLLANDAPLVFNCSAGKDRTGVAAALILSALDVPRNTIVDDYALSDNYVDFMSEFTAPQAEQTVEESPYAFLAAMPVELLAPLMESRPLYIETVLDALDREYGSIANYLERELGVDGQDIETLRSRLLY